MSDEQAAPETQGVKTELLGTVDLGPEIEGMEGRELRMRLVTIEPGGVYGPVHDHVDRPGIVYILQGTITDHRDGAATDYGPGLGWPEDRNTTHWLEVALRGFHPGATVTAILAGGQRLVREVHAGSSYLSSEDPRVHFGLGKATRVARLVIRYPDGKARTLQGVAANRVVHIDE